VQHSTNSVTALHSGNSLLASLPAGDFDALRPHLRSAELVHATVLIAAGEPLSHVYFPHSGIISLVVRLEDGGTVEVAMVGRDSVFGASAALDGGHALNDAVVQLSGSASILDIEQLRRVAEQSLSFRTTLIRHEQAIYAQALQSVGCNAAHDAESRLARWLLRARDLCGSDEMALTQEFLGQMIGVNRNRVSIVANTLQQAGLVHYSRGHIKITDVKGLMESACECYRAVKEQYDRLLHGD
jgi:CRP-like cAMP-binding protein